MISVDEIAIVKNRVDGIPNLPTLAVSSLRQLELMFLVAHDEVQRLQKFEARARLVVEKWELLKSAKQIARNQMLPAGFSSVVTSSDRQRCQTALELLYGGSDNLPVDCIMNNQQQQQKEGTKDENDQASHHHPLTADLQPPPKVATPRRKRQPHPSVYVDDEFSYDDVDTSNVGVSDDSPGSNNNSPSSRRYHRAEETGEQGEDQDTESSKPPPPPQLMHSSNSPSRTTSPSGKQNQQQQSNNLSAVDDSSNNFLDTLCCCKFISAIPKVVFELSFHREGDYAAVALAAALDELKLFESQLRSSQESFENLRNCWNHELQSLSRVTGVDLFEARVNAASEEDDEEENAAENHHNNQAAVTSSSTSCINQLEPCETADGKSWLAPPLLPLRKNFHANSDDLFAGYTGPSLLGPVVTTKSSLHNKISDLVAQGLQRDEQQRRSAIEIEAQSEVAEILSWRASESEMAWNESLYDKNAMNLRVLETKEELRNLKLKMNVVVDRQEHVEEENQSGVVVADEEVKDL